MRTTTLPGPPSGSASTHHDRRPRATLCLVHAHPDDESITTGGVILRAKGDGHRVVLITCTLGEEGEIHNLGGEADRHRLAGIRLRELRRACAILGVDRLAVLAYRDSGMAGASANQHPASFHQAPLEEAAVRVAGVMREEHPDVVVTYGPDGTYGHPDHVKAHQVTAAALDLLGGEGWEPTRVYWQATPRARVERAARQLAGSGSGPHPAMGTVGVPDHEITTEVDVRPHMERKRAAVAAHLSQNPPDLCAAMTGQLLQAMGGSSISSAGGGAMVMRWSGTCWLVSSLGRDPTSTEILRGATAFHNVKGPKRAKNGGVLPDGRCGIVARSGPAAPPGTAAGGGSVPARAASRRTCVHRSGSSPLGRRGCTDHPRQEAEG